MYELQRVSKGKRTKGTSEASPQCHISGGQNSSNLTHRAILLSDLWQGHTLAFSSSWSFRKKAAHLLSGAAELPQMEGNTQLLVLVAAHWLAAFPVKLYNHINYLRLQVKLQMVTPVGKKCISVQWCHRQWHEHCLCSPASMSRISGDGPWAATAVQTVRSPIVASKIMGKEGKAAIK